MFSKNKKSDFEKNEKNKININEKNEININSENAEVLEQLPPKKKLPMWAKSFYVCALVSVLLMIAFNCSKGFSDFFNMKIGAVLRAFLAYLTSWIPFSLGEMFVMAIPVILVFAIIYTTKHYCDSWHDVIIGCSALLSVLGLLFSVFTVGFASAYRGSTLDEKLCMDRVEVSAEELYNTADILVENLNRESRNVAYTEGGFSVMPYSYDTMNYKLMEAYDKACEKYPFIQKLHSRVKTVMLSELMSYTHITGVYTFFTGEANINIAFPDYTIPYTAAHEFAHQRGIAREDEANFVAFLVCMESDDPYIRYSGYLNLYDYVGGALYGANRNYYYKVNSKVSQEIKNEMSAYSKFFEKYRHSVVSQVSETVNNAFLVSQGTVGTRSYGMVVDLAVAYYKDR